MRRFPSLMTAWPAAKLFLKCSLIFLPSSSSFSDCVAAPELLETRKVEQRLSWSEARRVRHLTGALVPDDEQLDNLWLPSKVCPSIRGGYGYSRQEKTKQNAHQVLPAPQHHNRPVHNTQNRDADRTDLSRAPALPVLPALSAPARSTNDSWPSGMPSGAALEVLG